MPMEEKVIGIFVTVLLTAILIPVAFTQIFNANTTGWDSNTVTIFGLIPIIAVVGLILIIVFAYYSRRER